MAAAQPRLPGLSAGAIVCRSRSSTDKAVAELRKNHRLEPTDVGRVAMLRTVADLLDHELASAEASKWTAARLVAEWRALWNELTGAGEAGIDAELLAFFDGNSGAPVRDTP
jgi:hypothetical protein